MADFVAAIDQGTTSTRCMIFDHSGREVGKYQLEHKQIMPEAGWVEHDPLEIWQRTQEVVQQALAGRGIVATDLAGLGITNQRETTVVWDPATGEPYGNAIVWQDTRTDKIAAALDRDGRGDVIRHRAGLPPATYFSGGKLQWMLENWKERIPEKGPCFSTEITEHQGWEIRLLERYGFRCTDTLFIKEV